MAYEIERYENCGLPFYEVTAGSRRFRAGTYADAVYLMTALESLTSEQHMAALVAVEKPRRKHRAA